MCLSSLLWAVGLQICANKLFNINFFSNKYCYIVNMMGTTNFKDLRGKFNFDYVYCRL